jgi:hypothetical protein
MKRDTKCGVRSYRVNGYLLKKMFQLNLLRHYLMCAMFFANMVIENFETMFCKNGF